jgi:hypothetical protein
MPFGLLKRAAPTTTGTSATSAMSAPPEDHLQDQLADNVAGANPLGGGVSAWAHKTFKTQKYQEATAAQKRAAMNKLTLDDIRQRHGDLLREFMATEYTTENYDFMRDHDAGVDPQTLYTTYIVDRHIVEATGKPSARASNMVNLAGGNRFATYAKGDAGTLTRADLSACYKEIVNLAQQSVGRLKTSPVFSARLMARL